MAQNTATNENEAVDEQYRPVYEFEQQKYGTGKVVSQVPREAQVDALREIAGEGVVEPDSWIEGYNGGSIPVLNGVPIVLIEQSTPIDGGSEGAESWTRFAVDDSLGPVEIQRAGRHPTNVSKIKVSEKGGD